MQDKIGDLITLLKLGLTDHFRPLFVILLLIVVVGGIMALGAAFPILTPFLYSVF